MENDDVFLIFNAHRTITKLCTSPKLSFKLKDMVSILNFKFHLFLPRQILFILISFVLYLYMSIYYNSWIELVHNCPLCTFTFTTKIISINFEEKQTSLCLLVLTLLN